MVAKASIKSVMHSVVDKLPESATWEDLAYEIYVRQSIEQGIEDADAGRVMTTEEVMHLVG